MTPRMMLVHDDLPGWVMENEFVTRMKKELEEVQPFLEEMMHQLYAPLKDYFVVGNSQLL